MEANFVCSFCSYESDSYIRMSCLHQICIQCLRRRIFCYHISEFKMDNIIQVKCNCDKPGLIDLTINEIKELFSFCSESKHDSIELCSSHNLSPKEHYCNECKCFFFSDCMNNNHNHHLHACELQSTLASKIKQCLPGLSKSITSCKSFQKKCDAINLSFHQTIQTNFKETLANIEKLIRSLQKLKEKFKEEYIKELKKNYDIFKVIRMIYTKYYNDLKQSENTNDLNFLNYVCNCNYELSSIEIEHKQDIDEKIIEIQTQVDQLNDGINKVLNIDIRYTEVPKTYYCLKVSQNSHDQFIKSMIKLKDGNIVTGSFDCKIKIWKKDQLEYTNIITISKFTGKITSLLELNDKRMASGSSDSTIKIWLARNGSYSIQQSLSEHEEMVTCLSLLDDFKFISGSTDKQIIVWEETDGLFQSIQKIKEANSTILGLLLLQNGKLISRSDFVHHVWRKKEEEYCLSFSFNKNEKKKATKTFCELNDGRIACGGHHPIVIWKETEDDLFLINQKLTKIQHEVNCIIELRDKRLASSSVDHTIVIWKKDCKLSRFQIDLILKDYTHGLFLLIELNDNQICSTTSENGFVFWGKRNDVIE